MSGAAEAYDGIAGRYDALEESNRILAHMRRQSLAILLSSMPRGGRLLELGCGTGTEAVQVARSLRSHVEAFDPAPGAGDVPAQGRRGAGPDPAHVHPSVAPRPGRFVPRRTGDGPGGPRPGPTMGPPLEPTRSPGGGFGTHRRLAGPQAGFPRA